MMDIENKILNIVANQFSVGKRTICIYSKFEGIDKNFDELDAVEILMEVENEFNLSIDDKEADKWVTVFDIYNYVVAQLEILPYISRFELIDFEE